MSRTLVRSVALSFVALSGAGCSLAIVRPTPRANECSSQTAPALDGATGMLALLLAVDSAGSPVDPACPDSDLTCYTTHANRRSDVRAYGSIAAIYAASTIYGLRARKICLERLAKRPLEPPLIPTVAGAAPGAGATGGVEPLTPVPPEPSAPVEPVVAAPPAEPRPRDALYVRLTAGLSSAELGVRGGTMTFNVPNANVPIPMAFAVGAGVAVGDHVTVGGEWSLGYTMHSVSDETPDLYDRSLVLQHLGVVAAAYPGAQRLEDWPDVPLAPRGPYLRAGVAGAFLTSRPDETTATPGDPVWRANGLGLTAGCGWAWRFARRADWTVDVSLDLAWDRFGSNSEPTTPDSAFSYLLSFGATFF